MSLFSPFLSTLCWLSISTTSMILSQISVCNIFFGLSFACGSLAKQKKRESSHCLPFGFWSTLWNDWIFYNTIWPRPINTQPLFYHRTDSFCWRGDTRTNESLFKRSPIYLHYTKLFVGSRQRLLGFPLVTSVHRSLPLQSGGHMRAACRKREGKKPSPH